MNFFKIFYLAMILVVFSGAAPADLTTLRQNKKDWLELKPIGFGIDVLVQPKIEDIFWNQDQFQEKFYLNSVLDSSDFLEDNLKNFQIDSFRTIVWDFDFSSETNMILEKNTTPVPVPGDFILFAVGAVILNWLKRKRGLLFL